MLWQTRVTVPHPRSSPTGSDQCLTKDKTKGKAHCVIPKESNLPVKLEMGNTEKIPGGRISGAKGLGT